MTETLFHAYTPLILWTGLGLILFRFLPSALPRFLGRTLYWVGVPLEILALVRRTNFSQNVGLAPSITVGALILGFTLAWLSLQVWKKFVAPESENKKYFLPDLDRSTQGSFILAAMLGNTSFVGLAIAPILVGTQAVGLAVFYSVTQNIFGTYGLGVFLASYFGRLSVGNSWWIQIRDVLTVPSLWAFITGCVTHSIKLPSPIESGLQSSVGFVISGAFVLMGMRLAQIQGWKSFQTAVLPAILKVVVLPTLIGIVTTLCGLSGEPRLAMVLMSGMPTAFAGLILAEEYNLNRDLIASSIVVSTGLMLLMIPLWVVLFGQ